MTRLSAEECLRGINVLAWDTSQITTPQCLFACLSEDPQRQEAYIREALARGASKVIAKVIPKAQQSQIPNVSFIPHFEFQKLLSEISQKFFEFPSQKLRLFGVTGTNGKTTTSWFLHQLLNQSVPTGLIGTLGVYYKNIHENTPWTTPESPVLQSTFAKMLKAGISHVAMEASSIALEEMRLSGCRFDGLMFSNLTQDHLDYHGTMENYFDAKKKFFFEYSAPDASHIIYIDDPRGQRLAEELRSRGFQKVTTVSFQPEKSQNHVQIVIERESLDGTDVRLISPWGIRTYATPFIADFNCVNFALAATCCLSRGFSSFSGNLSLPSGRLERIHVEKKIYAFVDFAHTPDGLEQTLKTLHKRKGSRRLFVVFGCGGDRDKAKRPMMGRVASQWADRVFLTADNSRSEDPIDIINHIREGMDSSFASSRTTCEPDRKKAITQAFQELEPGDILCVAGKGHEQTQTDRHGTHPFSDQKVLRELDIV